MVVALLDQSILVLEAQMVHRHRDPSHLLAVTSRDPHFLGEAAIEVQSPCTWRRGQSNTSNRLHHRYLVDGSMYLSSDSLAFRDLVPGPCQDIDCLEDRSQSQR